MSFKEHSSLFTFITAAPPSGSDEATEKAFLSDLNTDIGAPFELYIRHTGNVGTTGILKYTDGTTGASANDKISDKESAQIGNNIHRILKYYLGSNYAVNDILQVRLNVVFKS